MQWVLGIVAVQDCSTVIFGSRRFSPQDSDLTEPGCHLGKVLLFLLVLLLVGLFLAPKVIPIPHEV